MNAALSHHAPRRSRAALPRLLPGVLLLAGTAVAAAGTPPVNADRNQLAIHGYDAVAYHTQQRPVPGSPEHGYRWRGTTWRFATASNRDLFAGAPERYAPQFGGYCAWAVSRGYTADIDPEAWAIVDGRLYLNYSKRVQAKWSEDRARNIALGEANWPKLAGK